MKNVEDITHFPAETGTQEGWGIYDKICHSCKAAPNLELTHSHDNVGPSPKITFHHIMTFCHLKPLWQFLPFTQTAPDSEIKQINDNVGPLPYHGFPRCDDFLQCETFKTLCLSFIQGSARLRDQINVFFLAE